MAEIYPPLTSLLVNVTTLKGKCTCPPRKTGEALLQVGKERLQTVTDLQLWDSSFLRSHAQSSVYYSITWAESHVILL